MKMIADWEKFRDFLRLAALLAGRKNLFFNASAITFNLFICALPFTLILISIIGYILSVDAAFDEILRYGRELLPRLAFEAQDGDVLEGAVTLERLVTPLIYERKMTGLIGFIILIFFAQGLLRSLKHVLFQVFDIEERKHPAIQFIYTFFTFGIVGAIFIFFSISVGILSLLSFDPISVPYTDIMIELSWLNAMFTDIIPIIFTCLLFYIIYRYISEKRIPKRIALASAIAYTVLFELARFGVSLYLEYAFTSYHYLYQGYTVLVILGLWVFYSAMLFIVTAVFARAYEEVYITGEYTIEPNPYTLIS